MKKNMFPYGHFFGVQYVTFSLEHILLFLIIFFGENVLPSYIVFKRSYIVLGHLLENKLLW